MLRVTCATVLALLALSVGMTGGLVFAQDAPALSVAPTKATMLVGETHTFRAVDKRTLAAQRPLEYLSRACCQTYCG